MIIDLSGRTALVCGSTSGIGRAAAMQLAASGARVILFARNETKMQELLKLLPSQKSSGGEHKYCVADFADTAEVKTMAAKIAAAEKIDILVNNTGGPPAGPISGAKAEELESAFNSHLINNHNISMALLPGMKERGWGRIINIISTSVKIPLPNLGVSNTIRGAVGNWSKTLANEVSRFGITVNNILPGATRTERLESIMTGKSEKTGKEFSEVEKEMLSEIPAGRFARPEEPAFAIAFLAGEQAAYITGTNIVVDGGRTGNL